MARCFAVALVVACSPILFAALPSPGEPAAVAEWFARVLRDGDAQRVERTLEPETKGVAWGEVRFLLGRHDCISAEVIDAATTWSSADLAVVEVRLRAAGLMKAVWQPRMDLPGRWYLELHRQTDGSWRLRSILPEESRVALCMLAEGSTRDADRIVATTAADPLQTIIRYAIYATEPEHDARFTPLMEHALALARETGSVRDQSWVLVEYAVHSSHRTLPESLERAQQAVDLARASGDAEYLANAYLGLALVHLARGQFEQAVAVFHEGSLLTEQPNDPVTALKVLYMHGWTLGQLHRDFEALRSYEKLRELSRRHRWPEGEEMATAGKGEILHRLGNLDQAVATWNEQTRLSLANGNPDHAATAYYNIAMVHWQQRRVKLAISTLEHAVDVLPPGAQSDVLLHAELAILQAGTGRLENAQQTLSRVAIRPGSTFAEVIALSVAKSTVELRAGNPDAALATARDAFDQLERKNMSGRWKVTCLNQIALALLALGRRAGAIEALRSAIDVVEAERSTAPGAEEGRISFFERQLAPYTQLVEIFVENENTVAEALRVAEQIKARTLLDASAGSSDLSAELSEEERQREQHLEQRVTEANRVLLRRIHARENHENDQAAVNDARVDLAGFRSEMRLKYPRRAQRDVAVPAQLSLADAYAIEFVVGDERTIAFLVPPVDSGETIRAISIPIGRTALTTRIDRYARTLSGRSFGYRAESHALYDTLIAPIASLVPLDAPLYVVPDGPLWNLPIHTLIAPDGAHLAEKREIAFTPSLAILHAERPQDHRGVGLLAFGNPRVKGTTRDDVRAARVDIPMGPLPETEDEVRTIAKLHAQRAVHVGADATESTFKREAARYRILHLATHGFVASRAPMDSGLVFTEDVENDGILEAREVAELKLGADLAVLSACDTASGQISGGEGVVGLSWAFLAAGCPTTVVSLWKADSAATAKLMIEFHRQIARGRTAADALRHAQTSLMQSETYRHPYYWAPFIVVGNNRVIAK